MRDHNPHPYPPDYVSADTLAYRLDCSRATIDAYVKEGRLPKPEMIGNLVRWDFTEVRAFIKAQNASNRSISNGEQDHAAGCGSVQGNGGAPGSGVLSPCCRGYRRARGHQ